MQRLNIIDSHVDTMAIVIPTSFLTIGIAWALSISEVFFDDISAVAHFNQ